jgi:hypothetical protein
MRTGGGGSESLMIVIPFAALFAVGTIMAGGPRQFLRVIEDWLASAVRFVSGS